VDSEKFTKGHIKLTKKEFQVLNVLAKSRTPLSSRDIEKEILGEEKVKNGRRDPEVYYVIENKLCIQKFSHEFYLFDWNELLSSIEEKGITPKKRIQSRAIDNLNRIGLDLADYDYNNRVIISKENHDSVITIASPRRSNLDVSLLIKIQKESKDHVTLTISEDGKKVRIPISLKIRKIGKTKRQIFYEGIIGIPAGKGTSYLRVSLNERANKKVERIKSMNPDLFNCTDNVKMISSKCLLSKLDDTAIISAVSEIESDRRNWKYSLNTRGLIFYVLGMIKQENEDGRVRNVEISNVLKNLSENYGDEFGFLLHYSEIEKLYNTLAEEKEKEKKRPDRYKHFQVKLSKQIALEFQYSLDIIDKDELDYHITMHYSRTLAWHFVAPTLPGGLLPGLVEEIPPIVRKYLVFNNVYLRKYLKSELEETEYKIKNTLILKERKDENKYSFNTSIPFQATPDSSD
jgi:hypothetical protein